MSRVGLEARQIAIQNNQSVYKGQPCKVCGETERFVCNWTCVKCSYERHMKTPSVLKAIKKHRKTNKFKYTQRKAQIKRKYGLSLEQYQTLLAKQKNKCAVCDRDQNQFNKRFAVDHNHQTGIIRALLCQNCNTALGQLNEDVTRIKRLLNYIRKHSND